MRLPFARRGGEAADQNTGPLAHGMDFHNHLLPAVDDGMEDLGQARETVAGLKALGFAGAVLTPHLYAGVFDNTAAGLRESFARFADALGDELADFPVYLAGEYFADEHFLRLIEADDLLHVAVGGARFVLLEFPYLQESPYAEACLAALAARGYRPVIAHVERYRFAAQAPAQWLEIFARAGAVLQGDIGSLAGQYGEPVRRFAQSLLSQNVISIWGTDVHKPAQLQKYIVPGLARLGAPGRLNTLLDPLLEGAPV